MLFILFFTISVYSTQTLTFDSLYPTVADQFSYFKSLQMRDFLGSKYEFPLLNLLDSQYVLSVSIGSPPQNFKLVPDILTSLSWVPSSTCWSLSCFLHTTYKSALSLTSSRSNGKFSQFYGSGKVSGFMSSDRIQVQSLQLSLSFGEVTGFEGPSWVAARFDGVLSLKSILSQLMLDDKSTKNRIQFTMTQETVQSVLGHCESGFTFLSSNKNNYFEITSLNLYIGTEKHVHTISVTIDLQTPLILIDRSLFIAISKKLKILSNCEGFEDLPNIVVEFAGGKIELGPEDYVLRVGDECLLGIVQMEFPVGWENRIVIGGRIMRKYHICYDLETSEVGVKRI